MSLTQQTAELHSQLIQKGSIHYNFHVNLQTGKNYTVLSEIAFELEAIP